MTIKLTAKYCGMAVLVLIVITFGPDDWKPRTALGLLFAVGGVLVAVSR
jgi:hypothetical protein